MEVRALLVVRAAIIAAMKARGWNSYDLADAADLDVPQVREFLFGDEAPDESSPVAQAIKAALGL